MAYALLKAILLPLLSLIFRPKVEGLSHVPTNGPAIIASNHLSFSDSIFMPLVIPRRVTFLAKSEYFTGKGIKGRATAATFRALGQVPVDRSGGRSSEAALETGLRILREGKLLGIYPEGTRSPDGRLYRGRTGIRFGEPLDFSRYEGMSGDRFILRSVTDEIMYALMDLGGQEYVDMYATRAKQIEADQAKGASESDE